MKFKKVIVFLLVGLALQSYLKAQTTAVTEEGDTIYVYPNGTWSFEYEEDFVHEKTMEDFLSLQLKIDTIADPFIYDSKVNKELTTQIDQFVFKYNDKSWKRVPPSNYNEEAEFAFENRENDIWAIIITEQAEVGLENILKISISTLEQNTGAVPSIKKTELRNVNGTNVLRGTLDVNVSGIEFVFDSYYCSDERGTTQIVTWTGRSIWEKHQDEIVNFLNGVIVQAN